MQLSLFVVTIHTLAGNHPPSRTLRSDRTRHDFDKFCHARLPHLAGTYQKNNTAINARHASLLQFLVLSHAR